MKSTTVAALFLFFSFLFFEITADITYVPDGEFPNTGQTQALAVLGSLFLIGSVICLIKGHSTAKEERINNRIANLEKEIQRLKEE